MSAWHPEAQVVRYPSAGSFINAGHKIVWHTTEGVGLPAYSGDAPHFTLNLATGKLWQHVPITEASSSLEHPAGSVETNHAHCIQVELIGYAKDAAGWNDTVYERIARLARWIEANASVPRSCGVSFSNTPHRFSAALWLGYSGHCGHQHVPSNSHWDPGALRIDKVLMNVDPIRFTDSERKTLHLLMATRAEPGTPARLLKRAQYRATLILYRQRIRDAARAGGGFKIRDRDRRYAAILKVIKGGKISLG